MKEINKYEREECLKLGAQILIMTINFTMISLSGHGQNDKPNKYSSVCMCRISEPITYDFIAEWDMPLTVLRHVYSLGDYKC